MIHFSKIFFLFTTFCSAQFNTISPKKRTALVQQLKHFEKVEIDRNRGPEKEINSFAFSFPLDTIEINSGFGERLHPITGKIKKHLGIDLKSKKSYVNSVFLGLVKTVNYEKGYGFHIRIENGGLEFLYAHLSEIYVSEGDIVENGQVIGRTGSTGSSTGDHLHFEVRMNNEHLDPIKFIKNLLLMSESNP